MRVVTAPPEYDQENEEEFRRSERFRDKTNWKKTGNVIIPFGMLLGFYGSNGQKVTFGLDVSNVFSIRVNDVTVIEIATDGDITSVLALLSGSIALTVDVNGRVAQLKLLSDGTLSSVKFKADAFQFYDGLTDRALIDAGGGILTINGDVAVTGSIVVGDARLRVGLETLEFAKADGETIQWASGISIGSAPKYTLDVSALNPLAAGEQYDVRLTAVTDIGATVRAKISTPGATAAQSETTDAAGGGAAPDRIMHKPTAADAYNGVYEFTISGTITVTSTLDGPIYINTGTFLADTYFNDGGGWDQGPRITIEAYEIVEYASVGSMAGAQSFTITRSIPWSQAIGQHGSQEFGVDLVSGGTLTDLAEVAYTSQAVSGERTASPAGEQVKIAAFPRNA